MRRRRPAQGQESLLDTEANLQTLDPPPPAQPSSATSEAAGESIRPAAGTLRAQVLEYLQEQGPATDEEIALDLGLNPSTERPRRIELVNAGLVEAAGEARTHSGRKAVLWAARRPNRQ